MYLINIHNHQIKNCMIKIKLYIKDFEIYKILMYIFKTDFLSYVIL